MPASGTGGNVGSGGTDGAGQRGGTAGTPGDGFIGSNSYQPAGTGDDSTAGNGNPPAGMGNINTANSDANDATGTSPSSPFRFDLSRPGRNGSASWTPNPNSACSRPRRTPRT